jgi:hypothetical protein
MTKTFISYDSKGKPHEITVYSYTRYDGTTGFSNRQGRDIPESVHSRQPSPGFSIHNKPKP